jgi:hypothetical protein
MTAFSTHYICTDTALLLPSVFSSFKELSAPPQVGMYNGGLLAVVDPGTSRSFQESWSWLVGGETVVLMTTGFGDLFLWRGPEQGIWFLEVQRGELEFIDTNVSWFLNEFLNDPDVVRDVLRKNRFNQLKAKYRPLKYHETFILEPWPMLGGTDKDDAYGIGQCMVYVSLVGQALARDKGATN